MIDWGKLKLYEVAKWKSFEELCYQIANRLYENSGKFTPIDDSGGGDGVEFYLTFPNGDEWGWQAKFYYPNIRLNVPNRKKSIRKSLDKSIKVHTRLKKWFLCTPSDFTTEENKWFKTLNKISPTIKLEHWGKRKFNNFINKPEFIGIQKNFFGDLELDINWFCSQVEKQISNVRDKFIPELHTETEVDFKIHCLLADSKIKEFIKKNIDRAKSGIKDFQEEGDKFEKIPLNNIPSDTKEQILKIILLLNDDQEKIIQSVQYFSNLVENGFIKQALDFKLENTDKLRKNIEELTDVSMSIYKLAQESPKEKKDPISYIWYKLSKLSEYLDEFNITILKIEDAVHNFKDSGLHIFGDALIGKTHIACHICEERIKNNLPAILLLGRDFTNDKTIERKILEILDIEAQYSWSDFILALESVADAYRTRILIVIDALNEAETIGIWRNQISGFIDSLKKSPKIVLITTCKTRYIDAIWNGGKPKNYIYAYGFDEDNSEEAINKYFSYYKLSADLTLAPLTQFKHPIYLRIFCEVKNPERKEEKQIYIGEQTLFEVFEEFLQLCNKRICEKLSKPPNLNIIQNILKKIAKVLWENKSRYINYSDAIQLIDGKTLSEIDWYKSFTKALLDEGLLISINYIDNEKKVSFTYDLLGGYLIAKHLLDKQSIEDIKKIVKSKEFEEYLLSDDFIKLHLLYEDILRSICVLLPTIFGKHLYELTKNNKAFTFSVNALFEIEPKLADENSLKLLTKLFNIPVNRKTLLQLLKNTSQNVGHPLNTEFLDLLLRNLSISERDLSWTEFVRDNSSDFQIEVTKFENLCRDDKEFDKISKQRLFLSAQYFSWLLTSTNRGLRDSTTKALYWFGRKFPERLFELTEKSLNINDPYVPERMLAASYGIAMALHNDLNNPMFREKILPQFAKRLYKLMFEKEAQHSTTHILMRDYARHTIQIALLHNSKLLNTQEKKRIRLPFKDGGIRNWKEDKDVEKKVSDNFNAEWGYGPIHMDFAKYIIGTISKHDYMRKNFPSLKKNLAMVIWRMKQLGYSGERFEEIDRNIQQYLYYERIEPIARGRLERYGKKYSWIAYFELAGCYADKYEAGEDWRDLRVRTSDVDIDPSFPEKPQEIKIIEKDYLKGGPKDLAKWIDKGPTPDISDYLVINKINNINGLWVLLDGYISQEDYGTKRDVFIFPRGFLINKKDIEMFNKYKDKISVENRALPEIEEYYYIFGGEIPWCETFSYATYSEKIEIPISTKIVKIPKKEIKFVYRKNGKEISLEDRIKISQMIQNKNEKQLIKIINEMQIEILQSQKIEEKKEVSNFEIDVELPVRTFCWGGNHSVSNPGQHSYVPSKEISNELSLHIEPQSFDMLDKEGKKASITFQWGDPWRTTHKLIYLRKDLLEKYLKKKDKQLVWIILGERQYGAKDNEGLEEFTKKHKSHYQVFKSTIFYSQIIKRGK